MATITLLLGGVIAASPAKADTWHSCARFGQHSYPNNYVVRNNMWNASSGQCITSHAKGDWDVTSNFTGTSVKTYPSVQRTFYRRVDAFSGMTSNYTVRLPSGNGIWEAAYDIWLQDWNIELMIWVSNHNQVPFGSPVASTTIYGQHWRVWKSGNDAFAFVLDHNQNSGTVHIKSILRWMVNHGYISNGTAMQAVEFGFEPCSTGGVNKTFHVDRYNLNWSSS
jgi:hypothetical protein